MARRLKAIILICFSLLLFMNVFMPQAVSACSSSSGFMDFPAWYQYLDIDSECNVSPKRYEDGNVNIGATLGAVLLAITEVLLRIAGIVAVAFVVYGGIQYTLSQGTPDKTAAAKNIILNGLIGLVIAVLAVSIVNLLSNVVT